MKYSLPFSGTNLGLNPLEGDSETEEIEDNLMGNTTSTFFPSGQTATTSFQQAQQQPRRAPVMGNRGLETQRIHQERSRSKSKSGHTTTKDNSRTRGSPRSSRKNQPEGNNSAQVVTLDERNLKRAVNRYGTMPKGARIGAYLESLRQSGMTPEPVMEQGVESDATVDTSNHASESMDRSMVGKPSKSSQMLRSNSSHGGFSANGVVHNNRAGSSPRTNPNQVRRLEQGSLERTGQAPADFDFPPPPVDLPPPSPSPRAARRAGIPDSNKENLPDKLERSSKSLMGGRFREVSSDSCESLGGQQGANNHVKSPMSPVSENRTLGSPAVGSLSSPGSTLDADHKRIVNKSDDAIKPFFLAESSSHQVSMESQLVHEISQGKRKEQQSPQKEKISPQSNTPAAMLVSELFESFKAKSGKPTPTTATQEYPSDKPEIDFKANLRKVKKPDEKESMANSANKPQPSSPKQIDFKSNLKKKTSTESGPAPVAKSSAEPENKVIDFKAKLRKSTKPEATAIPSQAEPNNEPVDFKARLRKVSGTNGKGPGSPTKEPLAPKVEKRDSLGSIDGEAAEDETNKRKSTGSISSLRKMWEASPKPGRATTLPQDLDQSSKQPSVTTPGSDDAGDKHTVKFEKRVWPPVPSTETEKPMVPVKPTVKAPAPPTTKPPPPKEPLVKPPPKPAMAVKPNVCNIYAAPTTTRAATSSSSKPPLASRPSTLGSKTHESQSGGSGCSSSELSERDKDKDELLGISQKLESSLDSATRSEIMNRSKLLKLSEDLGSFAESATGFVDNVPATGRFRFRSLLNKLEQQSGELRSSSVGKTQHPDIPAKLCGSIQITVRDLVTVIQR